MSPIDNLDEIPELYPISEDPCPSAPAPLPAPLLQSVVFSWLLGLVSFIFFICVAIQLHDPGYVSGGLISVFLIAHGIHIHVLWRTGGIEELCLRCVSSHPVRSAKLMSISAEVYHVICTDDDVNSPRLFEFRLGRDGQDFSANVRAIFYVNIKSPRTPVAWVLV